MSKPAVLIRKSSQQPFTFTTGGSTTFTVENSAKIDDVHINNVKLLETDYEKISATEIKILKTLADGDAINFVVQSRILKHAPYPNVDMSPVIGLEPDLEWLLKHEPFPMPDFDERVFTLGITEAITAEPHPEHPLVNTYKRTYNPNKRDNEYIKLQIDNAEEAANRELVTYRNEDKLQMLATGILIRKVRDGIEPNSKELEILDKIKAYDVPIWKNDAEKIKKKGQVDAGVEPNIDEGWQKSLPANGTS